MKSCNAGGGKDETSGKSNVSRVSTRSGETGKETSTETGEMSGEVSTGDSGTSIAKGTEIGMSETIGLGEE